MKECNIKGYPKVKGYLVEHGIRQREVADVIGISPSTLNNKLNGVGDFTITEVKKICVKYGLKAELFFTDLVPFREQKDENMCMHI